MTRNLTAGMVTEVTAPVLRPILLMRFEFDSGTLYFWNGVGVLTWDSNDYIGSGNLLSISPYEENQSLQAQGMTFTLSGIPTEIISIALSEDYQNRPATLWIGALDDDGALISDPYQIFNGFMDVMSISEGGETAQVSVSVENKMIIVTRTKESRYNGEDQKRKFSTDLGFDFVPFLQDKEIIWKNAS